ncbi:MAG: FAD-binding oxidoreductase [Oscillospiraceae bacterium]|jgi:sarcosine oxidase subunit beta|nr:FAD-binding oxidoreductase [Oscillospiraceae bacterium]MCI1990842.1 FAD-binding oxidoreductase [Oscillospiraceae bacterium]MCI2035105.1 FAD-binding oxidoreductase [Oscillospiraceae bacterium]
MQNTADVVIVGGGIIGCASAYYLAKKGVSVIVLESDGSIGNGGSSRNGGGVRQSGRDPRELPMVMWGIRHLWPTLSEELGVDVEYTQKGNLRLGKTETHLKILRKLTDGAAACGLDVKMIDGDEVRRINPYLSGEVIGASWCPTDGHANPLTATLGFYKRAREMGVRFLTGEPVTRLQKRKGKIGSVITPNNVYAGEKVLVAAGYESRVIAGTVGIDIPMQKVKVECLVTEAEAYLFQQMLGTAEADFYGHQTKHGSFVFGGSTGLEPCNIDNGTPVSSSIAASCICRGIMKYFPALSDAKIIRTWAGWIDECADKIPVIGPVEEVPGMYLACGFTGHGFGISPGAAYSIAEIMTGGCPPVDLVPFRYDRFRAKI